ncbi:hypothetical protein SAMN04487911_10628 [Arenibacter nanhaiticus]|uniref:Lipocalin-like domain-containing protein n=1 Tax=Arenibacter nanhaiticus TaxID=558155 RepID=A0A1M6E5A7_9FLAO|nr:hypothetical protein [Arenibacter nanhaiticus]SHI80621.1 hypothetical protein SAMN04487911_10628 [Arenibacter nanhaiticus]
MKKLLGLVFMVLFLVSATNFTSPKLQNEHSLEGTWELVSFNNYDGNEIVKTIPTTDGYRQIKMYYNGKVMWTRYVPKDSSEWFGYGSYSTTENSLTENIEYMSATMVKIAGDLREFKFELVLNKDNYSQITVDEEGNRTFSENYVRIK